MAYSNLSAADEERIQAIESILNTIQTAMNNLSSKQQLKQLSLLKQDEINSLSSRLDAVESQLTTLNAAITA